MTNQDFEFLQSVSLLYVEDNDDIRNLFSAILKRRVGTLHIASNGQEGLEFYIRYKPEVVVTDILMPVMDGLKMAEEIKAINSSVPVIVTTAFNETDFFQRAIDIGVDKYVIKPVNTELLLESIVKSARYFRAEALTQLSSAVYETSSDAITITDADNNIVSVNQAFCEITGYSPAEVIGKNPRMLSSGMQDEVFYRKFWADIKEKGRWKGEIWNRRKDGGLYPEWLSISTVKNRQGEITNYVAIFSDISERKKAEDKVKYLAHFDALTGLPNRILFSDRLRQGMIHAERKKLKVGVLFIDLDRFKNINDSLGHAVGDVLLQQVADRLISCVRDMDTVSRQGGDEFVVLITEISSPEDVQHIAQKILNAIAEPFVVDGRELHIGSSIGVSFYPDDGTDIGDLLRNADTAMYRAKEMGRNNIQFYMANMNSRSLDRLTLESNLRRALERGQFELYYQPQIDIDTGKIIGLEALIRWHHPDMGIVSPNSFISLAEETGLILPIGEWVLEEAATQAKAWQDSGFPGITMAINLSARQFFQDDFAGKVKSILDRVGLDPKFIELELTESMLMHNIEENIATLNELKSIGIAIAIDDFGTGYSSLSYLKRLPIDTLKIDRSFVMEAHASRDDAAIVGAIISLAKSMSLMVIAEGVENEEQLSFLKTKGCNRAQGFHFCQPLPAGEIEKLFSENLKEASG